MPITTYQRMICDRCGSQQEAPAAGTTEHYVATQNWVRLQFANAEAPGLTGADLREHSVLCPTCRNAFADWFAEAASP